MEKLFMELLKLSITGTLFVLAVLLLRLIFRKAPKWVFCMLWGLAALHLLIPFSVKTDVSVLPQSIASGQAVTDLADSYVGEVEYIYENTPNYSMAVEAGRKPVYSAEGFYVVTQKGSVEAPATVESTVFPVLSWIWLAGVVLMAGYTAVSYVLLKRKVATATAYARGIRQSESVQSPFVLGLIRPVIYLPYDISQQDMENVIAHEQAHIKRKDHWWKPLGFAVLALYWFNPVMWLAYVLLCRDIEGACDEKVIKNMAREDVRAYSTALLNCSVHHRRIAACPLAFGEVSVKQRIKNVMHYKKPAFWIILVAVAASVVTAVLLLTAPPEDAQPQIQQTEPTEPTEPTEVSSDAQIILDLVDEIMKNPAIAASSNPYDYINARYDLYVKIIQYGDTARDCLLTALEESADNGLREYIMAAACAELTKFGLNKIETPWASGKEWLMLYIKHTEEENEYIGTPEDATGSLIEVGSLLGVDSAWMRTVAVMDHPNRPDLHRYSYRFQYYDDDGQEWYLVEIHACLGYKIGDFDNDGINELFYYTDTEEYPYYLCDGVNGDLIEVGYTVVPDEVIDYSLLLDVDGLYLYEERWAWLLRDPETYVREVAKRPQDRLYFITPSGSIPSGTDSALIQNAYERLQAYLDGEVSTYEKRVVYKIMTTMEYTYDPVFVPGQINYAVLFEKWGFSGSLSTEERNCYDQIIACFDIDPMGFVRGMEEREEYPWPKDMSLVADRLAEVNCVYDRAAYDRQLTQLENAASTDAEKEAVQLLRWAYNEWKEPALDRQSLVTCSLEEFWRAFCYAPDQVLQTLESANATRSAWGIQDHGGKKLMDKGYAAVNRALAGNPSQAMKDAVYPILLILEMYGGYKDTYVPGQWFNYQRLFDKWTYSDGALATNCYDQMYDVFEADPAAFMRALTQWDKTAGEHQNKEDIALNFAYNYTYTESDSYLKILFGLLDGMYREDEKECVQAFIDCYQECQQDNG